MIHSSLYLLFKTMTVVYQSCRCYGGYIGTASVIKSKIEEWLASSVQKDAQLDCYLLVTDNTNATYKKDGNIRSMETIQIDGNSRKRRRFF